MLFRSGEQEVIEALHRAVHGIGLSLNTTLAVLISQTAEHAAHFGGIELAHYGKSLPGGTVAAASASFHEIQGDLEGVAEGVRSLLAFVDRILAKSAQPGAPGRGPFESESLSSLVGEPMPAHDGTPSNEY